LESEAHAGANLKNAPRRQAGTAFTILGNDGDIFLKVD